MRFTDHLDLKNYLKKEYPNYPFDNNTNLLSECTNFVLTPVIIAGQYPAIKNEFTDLRFQKGDCPPPTPIATNMTDIYIVGNSIYTIEYETGFYDSAIKSMIDSIEIM